MAAKPTTVKRSARPSEAASAIAARPGRAWVYTGKGGTGKSALLNCSSSLAALHGRESLIFDMDDSNPTSKRFFQLPPEQIVGSIVEEEVGATFANRIWPRAEAGENVLIDLGGSGEVPFLKWCAKTDAGELTGERLIFAVVIGTVDSLGTARTVVQNAKANPVLLFVNKAVREHRLATESPEFAPVFKEICAAENVRAVVDFPDVGYALAASSRVSQSVHDVSKSASVGMFERGAALKGLRTLAEAFKPIADWLP